MQDLIGVQGSSYLSIPRGLLLVHLLAEILGEGREPTPDNFPEVIITEVLERLSHSDMELLALRIRAEALMYRAIIRGCLAAFHDKAAPVADLLLASLEHGYKLLVKGNGSFLSIDEELRLSYGLSFTLSSEPKNASSEQWEKVFRTLFLTAEFPAQVEAKYGDTNETIVRIPLSSFRQSCDGLNRDSSQFECLTRIAALRRDADCIQPLPSIHFACDILLAIQPRAIDSFLCALRSMKCFGVASVFETVGVEDFLKRAIDSQNPALMHVLLEAGADSNAVIRSTDERASVIGYACARWLERHAAQDTEAVNRLEQIIQDLKDFAADLGVVAQAERAKQLQDIIDQAWERRFEGRIKEQLATMGEKLREEFGTEANTLSNKVNNLEKKLQTISQSFWDRCDAETVNNEFLRKTAELLADKLLEETDAVTLLLPSLREVISIPELKCRNNHDIFLHPSGSSSSWTCDCAGHVGSNDFKRHDPLFSCRKMHTCDWMMCETCYRAALLRHKCSIGLKAFCKLLQSGLRVTLSSLVAAAGGNVDPSVAGKSILHALAAQVPFVGELLKAGLQNIARVQRMAENKHLVSLFMCNDTQAQDRVLSDYAARVAAFACLQIFVPPEESGSDQDILDTLQERAAIEAIDTAKASGQTLLSSLSWKQAWRKLKRNVKTSVSLQGVGSLIYSFIEPSLASFLLKVKTDPDIQEHWHALVANYVSSFLGFLADDSSPYLETEKLGIKAAEHVLPAYSTFKVFPDIQDWRIPKNLFNAAEVCRLSSANRESVMFTLHKKWKVNNAHVFSVGRCCLVTVEAQNHLYLVFHCPDSLSKWASAFAGDHATRVSVSLPGSDKELLVDHSLFSTTSELLRSSLTVDLPNVTENETPADTSPLLAALLKFQQHLSGATKGTKAVSDLASEWLLDASKKVSLLGFGRGGAMAGLAHILLANDVFRLCAEKNNETKFAKKCLLRMNLITFASFPWCDPSSSKSLTEHNWELLCSGAGVVNIVNMGDGIVASNQHITGLSIPGPFGYIKNNQLLVRREAVSIYDHANAAEDLARFLRSIPRLLVLSSSEWIDEVVKTPLERMHSLGSYVRAVRKVDSIVVDDGRQDQYSTERDDDVPGNENNIVIALDSIEDRLPATFADTRLLESIVKYLSDQRAKRSSPQFSFPGLSIESNPVDEEETNEDVENIPLQLMSPEPEVVVDEALIVNVADLDVVSSENLLERLLACAIDDDVELAKELVWRMGDVDLTADGIRIDDIVCELCAHNRVEILNEVFMAFGVIACPTRAAIRRVEELTMQLSSDSTLANSQPVISFSLFPSELRQSLLKGAPFLIAVVKGYHGIVSLLLQNPHFVESYLTEPETIRLGAHHAAQNYEDIFELLLCSSLLQAVLLQYPIFYTLAAYRGKVVIIDSILKNAALDVNMSDSDGDTMFLSAAKAGKVEVMRLIVELRRTDLNASWTSKRGKSALCYAASQGRVEAVRFILESDLGVDVNFVNGVAGTALSCAISSFNVGVVRYLLSRPGIQYDFGEIYSDIGAIFVLVANAILFPVLREAQSGAVPFPELQVNRQCSTGETLLHAACQLEDCEMISILLEHYKADPNLTTTDGRPPIYFAMPNMEAFRIMTKHQDINLNFADNDGGDILDRAVCTRNRDIVGAILDDARFVSNDNMLFVVSFTDDVQLVEAFLRRHSVVELPSLLQIILKQCCEFASSEPLLNICDWLLKNDNIDPNAATGLYPPLIVAACSRKSLEIFELLVCCPRVDVNITCSVILDGQVQEVTCLDILIANNDSERVLLLLEKASERLDLSRTPNGVRPLQYAIAESDSKMFEMFFRHRTLPREEINRSLANQDSQIYYAHAAICCGQSLALELLLSREDLDLSGRVGIVKEVEGNTVLHIATLLRDERKGREILKLLLADARTRPLIDEVNSLGLTALGFACVHHGIWALQLLYDYGADVSKSRIDTHPPIFISLNNNEAFDFLFPKIDVNSVPSLLNMAITKNNSYVVSKLLSHRDFEFPSGSSLSNQLLVSISSAFVNFFVDRQVEVHDFVKSDAHPLFTAVLYNNQAAVDCILDYLGSNISFEIMSSVCQIASKSGFSGIIGCFVAKGLLSSEQEDTFIESSVGNAFDKAKLYYSKTLVHIRRSSFGDAETTLRKCILACPYDFQVTSAYVSLVLHRDRGVLDRLNDVGSLFPDITELSFVSFIRAMFYYHSSQFLEAMQILNFMTEPSALRLGVVSLKSLVLIRMGHYDQAWSTYRQLETFRQSPENSEDSISDYSLIAQYALGLLLFCLGSLKASYRTMQDVCVKDRQFIEPLVVCAEIAYSAGFKTECDSKVRQIMGRMFVLPLIERNALLNLQDRLIFDKLLERQRRAEVEYLEKGRELDEKLSQLVSYAANEEIPANNVIENILRRWPLDYVQSCVKELFVKWSGSLISRRAQELRFHCVEHLADLINTEALVPLLSRWDRGVNSLTYLPPPKRKRSARRISLDLRLSDSQAVKTLMSDIDTLLKLHIRMPAQRDAFHRTIKDLEKKIRMVACEGTGDITQDLDIHELEKSLLLHTKELDILEESFSTVYAACLYLESCKNYFFNRYGSDSEYFRSFSSRDKYWLDLAAKVSNKDLSFHENPRLLASKCLIGISIQNLPSNDTLQFLRGFDAENFSIREWHEIETERENQLKSNLYEWFVFNHMANRNGVSTSAHYVFHHEDVYYKLAPYAPGIEFAVNSLSRLLLEELAIPTRLLRIEGFSVPTWARVVHYQASLSVPGCSFDKLLAKNPEYIKLIDMRSFSALLICSLLVGTGDCKPDNLIAQVVFDETGKNIKCIKLIDIDKDISFCSGRLGFRKLSATAGKLYSDFLNTLFFLPQMDQPVHSHIRELLTRGKFPVEDIMATWLSDLFRQNVEYEQLVDSGMFTRYDMSKFKLPIQLRKCFRQPLHNGEEIYDPGTAAAIYERLLRIQALFSEEREVTHNLLLREFYPSVSTYYETKRVELQRMGSHQNIMGCIKQLYLEACDDAGLKKDLKYQDRVRSTTAWQTISSRKMMDESRFKDRFNGTIDEIAEEFVETINFSRFDTDVNLLGALLLKNLEFIKVFRLCGMRCSAGRDQFSAFFDCLRDGVPLAIKTGNSKLKSIELIDFEADENYFRNTTIFNILQRMNITVTIRRRSNVALLGVEAQSLPAYPVVGADDRIPEPPNIEGRVGVNNPVKENELKMALVEILEHADNLEQLRVSTISEKIAGLVRLVQDVEIPDMSFLGRVSSEDAVFGNGIEQLESLLFQFSMLMLDFPLLCSVGLAMAMKGAFANNRRLLVRMIHHRDANKFVPIVAQMIQMSSAMLCDADESLSRVGDEIFASTSLREDVKERLYCLLINTFGSYLAKEFVVAQEYDDDGQRAHLLVNETRLFSGSTLDKLCRKRNLFDPCETRKVELLCIVPAFGFPVSIEEWRKGAFDFSRVCCAGCGLTLIHRVAVSREPQLFHRLHHPALASLEVATAAANTDAFSRVSFSETVVQAMYKRVRLVLIEGYRDKFESVDWLNRSIWAPASKYACDLWSLALRNYRTEVIDDVYEYWDGNGRHPKTILPLHATDHGDSRRARVGESTLIVPRNDNCDCDMSAAYDKLRLLSRIFSVVRWDFTAQDAWLYDLPEKCGSVEACLQRIKEVLNTRADVQKGNSLLYEMVVTPQRYFYETFGEDRAKLFCIREVLLLGADPLFTKRKNKKTALDAARENNSPEEIITCLEQCCQDSNDV